MDSCLQKAMTEIKRATEGMTTEQLAWHPKGKWSAAEVLEHLTLTFSGTVRGMQKVLASPDNGAAQRTLQQRLATWIVIDIGYFPKGRPAPSMTVPQGTDPAGAVASILRNLTEMDTVLSDVEKKKGSNARVTHPVIGPLTIGQWRKFHLIHTRHHMKQVDRLRELMRAE